MTQVGSAKRVTRKRMYRYSKLPTDNRWRALIDAVYADYSVEFPDKAQLLRTVFMLGYSKRKRLSCDRMAMDLCVSTKTLYNWLEEIVLEVMYRAAREKMV